MQRIGIVGAGLSGLVTAKTFLEEGFDVTVFETEDEVGGVWARSRRYPGIATQNPRDTYAFSDFPMPRHYPEWPSGEQVQAYLAAYADRFGVTPRVRFRTRVNEARPCEDGRPGWTVRVSPVDGDGAAETLAFDWLVICNGVFCAPHVPELPGREAFEAAGGRALHSSEFHDAKDVAGKRVAVVGFAKSAADVACAAVGSAGEATLVYRRALWKMPKFFFGFVNLKFILTTRFSEALFRYRRRTGFERVLHGPLRPLVWAFWRGIETVLRATFRLDACGMRPEAPIEKVVACNLSLASGDFYEHVRTGRLRAVRGAPARFSADGLELEDGTRVGADVVIFGTGFRQGAPFLADYARRRVVDADGVFRLYRNIVHPDVPRLGFVGYNSSLYSQLTSEIGARWLARLVMGEMRLPGRAAMLAEVDERLAWLKAERPDALMAGTCIVPFNLHYINDLLRDLGARTWRTRTRFAEYMMPMDPRRYADLKAELDARRLRRAAPHEPALARPTAAAGE